MDPIKVKGVLDWPIPQNLKDVLQGYGRDLRNVARKWNLVGH